MGQIAEILRDAVRFRIVPNAPRHSGPTLRALTADPLACRIAIVEFDDQGVCFDRSVLRDVDAALADLDGASPVILVFVHGWKHDAAAEDGNLASFTSLLQDVAAAEKGGAARPVLGVFASWRGLSRSGNWVWEQSSFWDRQQAAQRVAAGSARELLGRLKAFRNGPSGDKNAPRATLIVVGHSFGGLIVYAALAQSLIEAAASEGAVVPSFGDLVLLVNPAFSAISYLPIHQIVAERQSGADQLPVFVSVTARNDWATGLAFPVGNVTRLLTEAWRGPAQRKALIRTMGHVPWMRTHALSTGDPAGAGPGAARLPFRALAFPGMPQQFGNVTVTREAGSPAGPFWVASATKPIIDGHNGIFTANFEMFVRALVLAHLAASRLR